MRKKAFGLGIAVLFAVGCLLGLGAAGNVGRSEAKGVEDMGVLSCASGFQCFQVCDGDVTNGVCETTEDNTVMCKWMNNCTGCLHAIDAEC